MGRVNPNMTKVYREVVSRFMAEEEKLTHKQEVTRLYKKSLKTLESWIIDRRLWNEEATKIRAEFDANSALDVNSGYVYEVRIGSLFRLEEGESGPVRSARRHGLVIAFYWSADEERYVCVCGSLTKRLVREAEEKVTKYTHPDRYVFNYMPGGTKFMRNAPLPLEVCFPDGVPADVEVSAPVNIDITPLPAKPTVFVDFSKKGYD